MDTAKNIFFNVSPVGSFQDVGDAVTHAAPETLVQKVVDRMFNVKQGQGWIEAFATHVLSIPFIGGLGYPIAPIIHPQMDAGYYKQLQAGVAGVPAVFLARYLIELLEGERLLHWNMGVREMLSTAVSKTVTRSLISTLGDYYPDAIKKSYNRLQMKFDDQARTSILSGNEAAKDDLPGYRRRRGAPMEEMDDK